MKCFFIVDAQNDFLPQGSFNSKTEYLDVLHKINSIRLKLYNCNEENLISLKDCMKLTENKESSHDKNIEEYYKCHSEIDDEKSLDKIFIFPFFNNSINLNGYRTLQKRYKENSKKKGNFDIHFEGKNEKKSYNGDVDKYGDNINEKFIEKYDKLQGDCNLFNFSLFILSVDYHPQFHISFAETHKIIYEQICNNNLYINENKTNEKLLSFHNKNIQEGKDNESINIVDNLNYNFLKNNNINNLSDVWKNIKRIRKTKEIYKNVNSINDIKEFQKIEFLNQTIDIWPVHCVKNTRGCKVHEKLIRHLNDIIVKKAQDENKDSYTIFENEEVNENLINILKEKNVTSVYICGFIFEYCVKETALSFLKRGYETYIIEDATAYLYEREEEKNDLKKKGIKFIQSYDIFA
ncbi:nicotinamidase, putative [Plasmodium gallinaceum]|uniref:nicotinamidase n=1 Tax=Plasmodium gallinaceum TaxID=5849 RepID=A0A1J1GPN2_PLAGA|nr:nicotinamidase, putative [Plasmodium gallinaceum]CRG94254.1 nicotinamidase, putative [Plasmodium gallinaceum]